MYKYNIYTYTILEQSIEFSMNWAQSPSEDRICYRDTRAVIARYQFPLCRKKKHILNNTDSSTTLFLTNVFFILTFTSLFLFLFIVGVCLGRGNRIMAHVWQNFWKLVFSFQYEGHRIELMHSTLPLSALRTEPGPWLSVGISEMIL